MSRTVIDLNDKLIREAKRVTGLSKKVQVVNYALEELVKRDRRKGLLKLMGSGCWEGNLDALRRARV